MLHPKELSSHTYTYLLPDEQIARFPLAARDQSRLLVYGMGPIREDIYLHISKYLQTGSLLVFNNTRVIRARILFQKPSGGMIEVFMLEPEETQSHDSLLTKNKGTIRWKCLIGGASKWKWGQVMQKEVLVGNEALQLLAQIADRRQDCFIIEFKWKPAHASFIEILEQAGSIPIPPYLKREAGAEDTERYQTIYARELGSVAAPTAGLHFTDAVFSSLAAKQIGVSFITLHVGAGTFAPVKSSTLEGHSMHAEWMRIEIDFIGQLIEHEAPVIAVGTTSLRTLESLYWMGIKCLHDPAISSGALAVEQWEPYENKTENMPDAKRSLQALQQWMQTRELNNLAIETRLLIAPPYRPRIASGLVSNFHQPGSTLLVLVAAVTDGRWKEIYDHALQQGFRFLSYGDGCLIFFD